MPDKVNVIPLAMLLLVGLGGGERLEVSSSGHDHGRSLTRTAHWQLRGDNRLQNLKQTTGQWHVARPALKTGSRRKESGHKILAPAAQAVAQAVGARRTDDDEREKRRERRDPRICVLMVDRRPLDDRDVNPPSPHASPLLAAVTNLHYASTQGYAFVFANYSLGALEGRHFGWSKVAVLRELMLFHHEIEFVVFLDGDATFHTNRPLQKLPELREFFEQKAKLFFFARAPPNSTNPSKSAQWQGQFNTIKNTDHTCGFFIVRNTREAFRRVEEWWAVPDRMVEMTKYKYLWPHCQRCWDDVMRPRYPQMWSQAGVGDFNTPSGKYVRHVWWKNNPVYTLPWKRDMLSILKGSDVRWMHTRNCETGSFPSWWGNGTGTAYTHMATERLSLSDRLLRYGKVVIPLEPRPQGRAAQFTVRARTLSTSKPAVSGGPGLSCKL